MSYYMIPSHPAMATGGLMGFGAFGATDFNPSLVWADCEAGASGNNAAGKNCGMAIQMALNKLGYGPLTVDGQVGKNTIAALKQFGIDNGFGAITWPTKAAVIKMDELMRAGATPGPSAPIESHVVGGEVVPGAAPGSGVLAKAGITSGTALAIGAVALVGIGALALMAKKKKGSPGPQKVM